MFIAEPKESDTRAGRLTGSCWMQAGTYVRAVAFIGDSNLSLSEFKHIPGNDLGDFMGISKGKRMKVQIYGDVEWVNGNKQELWRTVEVDQQGYKMAQNLKFLENYFKKVFL